MLRRAPRPIPLLLTAVLVAATACGGGSDHKGGTNAAAKNPQNVEQGPSTGAAPAQSSDNPSAANSLAAPEAAASAAPGASASPGVATPAGGASSASPSAAGPASRTAAGTASAAAAPGSSATPGGAPTPGSPGTPAHPGAPGAPATPGAPAQGAPANLPASDVGVSPTAIKVGQIGILSGPVSSVGADLAWAGEAVLQATNDAGGINGRKLDVKVRDDAWDGTKGMNAARDLVEREKIFSFCCTMTVATTDLLAKYTDEVQVPNVSSDGFGDDQYGKVWDWPAANSATNDGYAMAEYAVKKQGVKTIAMLYFDNPFGRSYKEGYTYYAEKLGAKVVVTQAGSFDDPGTATFIAKARAANVDLLTFNGEPGLWVKMVREAASQGYKPRAGFQGAAGIYFDEIPGLAGPWAEGSISATHWTPNDVGEAAGDKDPAYAKYSALITKYYPHIKHSNWTKANYSGSLYFVDAVRRLGANVTRKGLKDVLDATKVWDVGLGAKVEYWCNHRGNHSEYLVKLVKDPDAANSPDSRTRDAARLGGGMRFKFLEGPYGDPVNHPDGTSDVAAFSRKCA